MTTIRLYSFALVATLLFSSCDHKELCFDHEDHEEILGINARMTYEQTWHEDYSYYLRQRTSSIDVDMSWLINWPEYFETQYDDLVPSLPTGVGVAVFHDDGTRNGYNIEQEGGTIPLREGDNSILFYNNDTEYIVFEDAITLKGIAARTRTRARDSYTGSPFSKADADETTVNQPDMLYVGFVDAYRPSRAATPSEIEVAMRPLVYIYFIHFEINHGRESVSLARGAISGMAASAKLFDGSTTDELATILFDCNLTETGAEAAVNTFGVPEYVPGATVLDENGEIKNSDYVYGLNLEIMLKNGQVVKYDFNVTNQVEAQPNGGVILIKDINIPDEELSKGSSGFDVNVNDWGEYQDYDLPL